MIRFQIYYLFQFVLCVGLKAQGIGEPSCEAPVMAFTEGNKDHQGIHKNLILFASSWRL